MRKINIAIVGFGYIGKEHYKCIKNLSLYYKLNAICESNFLSEKKLDVKIYKNIHEMLLKNKNIDMVTICSPSYLHASQLRLILKFNKFAIVEKPMTINVKDIKGIKFQSKFVIIHQLRLMPYFLNLKKIMEKLGKVYLVEINSTINRNIEYFNRSSWKGKIKFDGGAIYNQMSHHVDLLSWFFGKIKNIKGFKSYNLGIQNEDTASMAIRFRDNINCSFSYTLMQRNKSFGNVFKIVAEFGTIMIYGKNFEKIKLIECNNFIRESFEKIRKNQFMNKGYEEYYKEIYRVYNNKRCKTNISMNDSKITIYNLDQISKNLKKYDY